MELHQQGQGRHDSATIYTKAHEGHARQDAGEFAFLNLDPPVQLAFNGTSIWVFAGGGSPRPTAPR